MATGQWTAAPTNNSDANFRLWGSALSAQLAAMGWVQTSDTGQINWTTVTAPTASASAGYEIWRLDDALQATAPVYIRIDYAASGTAATPSLWYTVGTGTDGAGNMNADACPIIKARGGSNAVTAYNCYISGAANRMVFALFNNSSAQSMFFSLERTKDAAGADTADGVLITWTDSSHTAFRHRYYQLGIGSSGESTLLSVLMPGTGTGISGGNTSVYPIYFPKGPFLPYGMNYFAYFHVDIPALNSFTMTIYGATRTLLPLGNNGHYGHSVTGSSIMIRWE